MDDFAISVKTLANRPDGAIVSIGITRFDIKKLGETMFVVVDQKDSIKHGSVDPAAIWQWMNAGVKMREQLDPAQTVDGPNLHGALCRVKAFVSKSETPRVWGNGLTMGVGALTHAFNSAGAGMTPPWTAGQLRDLNTLMLGAGVDLKELPKQGDEMGHALADSIWWAGCVQMVQQRMARLISAANPVKPAKEKAAKETPVFKPSRTYWYYSDTATYFSVPPGEMETDPRTKGARQVSKEEFDAHDEEL